MRDVAQSLRATQHRNARFRHHSLTIVWGVSPSLVYILALFMLKLGVPEPTVGLIAGPSAVGGPFVLMWWSFYHLSRTSWSDSKILLMTCPVTALACLVNVILAGLAWTLIDPPLELWPW